MRPFLIYSAYYDSFINIITKYKEIDVKTKLDRAGKVR
jgi:hypothetical protein